MDVRQLEYFRAVCEHRNISHAAVNCNVAQSALSHHIARLEAELETELFVRKPRGMEPTSAGLLLYEHARRVLDALERAKADVRRDRTEIAGDIAVSMPFTVIKLIGVPLMTEIAETYPRLRLLLEEAFSGAAFDLLRDRRVNLTVAFNRPADARIISEPLLEEEIFCVGRAEIVGEADDPISLAEMARLPIVLLKSGALMRGLTDRPSLLRKIDEAAHIRLASVAATIGALENGLGCTLAPRSLVDAQLQSGRLRARRLSERGMRRTLYLGYLQSEPPTRAREVTQDLIRRITAAAVDDKRWPAATPAS